MEKVDSQIAHRICSWFQKNKRNLAWRNSPNAYNVLVSEIMLQQTRVETVKSYYTAWMKKFPTLEKLANAKLSEVFKLWEGLGYYRRCENLWKTARYIKKNWQGEIPRTKKELLELAGIGDYTASAICSLAYNQKIPAIDCNVKRVISRLYLYKKNIQTNSANQFFEKKITYLLQFAEVKILNQALMELGALICVAKNPNCAICPLQKFCNAFQNKLTNKIPNYPLPKPATSLTMDYWIIENKNKQLLICNPQNTKWWKGMWVFPYFFQTKEMEADYFLSIKSNLQFYNSQKLGTLKHQVTRYKILANYWLFTEKHQVFDFNLTKNFLWLDREKLQHFSLPKASRYAIKLL